MFFRLACVLVSGISANLLSHCFGGRCQAEDTFHIPDEHAASHVATFLCTHSRIGAKSWTRLLGTKLPATAALTWEQQKALVLFAGAIVDTIQTSEKDAARVTNKTTAFLKTSGLKDYLESNLHELVEMILTQYPETWETVWATNPSLLCRQKFERAPLWNLDIISPSLFASDSKIKRVVIHHKALREVNKTNHQSRPIRFFYDIKHPLDSIKEAIWSTNSKDMMRMQAQNSIPVAEWTNAFVRAAVTETELFRQDLPGHATVRVNFAATITEANLKLYYHLGRVLGLMLVRGVALDNIFFQGGLYVYLVGEKANLEAIRWDYPTQYDLLYKAFFEDEDVRGKREALMSPFTPKEREYLSMYKMEENLELAKAVAWFYCEGRSGQAFEKLKEGFWKIVPVSLKITSTDLRQVMTEGAEVTVLGLQRAVNYEGLSSNSVVAKEFWSIVEEGDFPVRKLLVGLTGSGQVPIGGFREGNPKMVIGRGFGNHPTMSPVKNALLLPTAATRDTLREDLLNWLTRL